MIELVENISIDCVIFGFENNKLKVLLIKRNINPRKGWMALPGGFIRTNEDLDTASRRILWELTGIQNLYMEQVHTFGDVDRYPDRRVITVAYVALININNFKLTPGNEVMDVRWADIDELPQLPFDHHDIFQYSLNQLRRRVRHEPVGFNLLPNKFTLPQLQSLYEAILDMKFDKRNFRRKIHRMNFLIDLGEKQQDVPHRAAKLYSFEEENYKQLKEKGFNFDL